MRRRPVFGSFHATSSSVLTALVERTPTIVPTAYGGRHRQWHGRRLIVVVRHRYERPADSIRRSLLHLRRRRTGLPRNNSSIPLSTFDNVPPRDLARNSMLVNMWFGSGDQSLRQRGGRHKLRGWLPDLDHPSRLCWVSRLGMCFRELQWRTQDKHWSSWSTDWRPIVCAVLRSQ